MKTVFASKESRGLVVSVLFLLLGMLVIWVLKTMVVSAGDAVFISLLLIPLAVYTIFTGQLTELKAPGGLEAKFSNMAEQPASELATQHVELIEEELVSVPKDSLKELDRLEKLAQQSKRIILKIALGRMNIKRDDAEEYLTQFLLYQNFNHVVFLDKKARFIAFVPPWVMLRIIQGEEGNRFIDILNQGNIMDLLDFPGVKTNTISTQTNYKDALQAMTEANLDTILVVDNGKKVKGVIEREQILSKFMLAMTK